MVHFKVRKAYKILTMSVDNSTKLKQLKSLFQQCQRARNYTSETNAHDELDDFCLSSPGYTDYKTLWALGTRVLIAAVTSAFRRYFVQSVAIMAQSESFLDMEANVMFKTKSK